MTKKSSNIDDLLVLPWWLTLILAGVAYVGLRFVLPNVQYHHPAMSALSKSAENFAGAVALVLLVASLVSLLMERRRQKRDAD